jgi:hypothetical protein
VQSYKIYLGYANLLAQKARFFAPERVNLTIGD